MTPEQFDDTGALHFSGAKLAPALSVVLCGEMTINSMQEHLALDVKLRKGRQIHLEVYNIVPDLGGGGQHP